MIKEIFNLIKDYANDHQMINSFNYGDTFNIEKTGEDMYPQVYIEYPFNIKYFKQYKEISITYYIIELPKEDQSDEIDLLDKVETLNDILLMKLDLLDYDEFSSLEDATAITLTEWMGDKTVAIRTEVSFKVLRDLNSCNDPISNI